MPPHWTTMLTKVEPEEKGHPRFRKIYLSNVKSTNTGTFINAAGWSESLKIEDLAVNNIVVDAKSGGRIKLSDNFLLQNVQLTTQNEIVLEDNTNLKFDVKYQSE